MIAKSKFSPDGPVYRPFYCSVMSLQFSLQSSCCCKTFPWALPGTSATASSQAFTGDHYQESFTVAYIIQTEGIIPLIRVSIQMYALDLAHIACKVRGCINVCQLSVSLCILFFPQIGHMLYSNPQRPCHISLDVACLSNGFQSFPNCVKQRGYYLESLFSLGS